MSDKDSEIATVDKAILRPHWPAPRHIVAGISLRSLGSNRPPNQDVNSDPYRSGNMAQHVGDCPERVTKNRHRLATLATPHHNEIAPQWQWLEQQHSNRIATIEQIDASPIAADGLCTSRSQLTCTVLSADCLPILLSDSRGRRIAAIHAGWRGLASGIIDNSIAAFCRADSHGEALLPQHIYAWLGPAIGADHFEVGDDVVAAFTTKSHEKQRYRDAFEARKNGKYSAHIYLLARRALSHCGVEAVYGGDLCTACDTEHFFSYRRDGRTGRMASFITIAAEPNNP